MDDVGRVIRRWACLCDETDLRLLARLGDGGGLPHYSEGVEHFLHELADAVRAHLALRHVDFIAASPEPIDELPPVA